MIYLKNEIFYSYYEFDKILDEELVISLFVLFNKYYPSYKIIHADFNDIEEVLKWEDFILNDYKIISKHDMSIWLDVPFCLLKEDTISLPKALRRGVSFFYGLEEDGTRNAVGINFYGNVYTNIRHDFDPENRVYVPVDQSACAKKNREIMTAFLKELEILLEGEITEFLSPFYLDEKYIFKYGIKSDAVLK